MDEQLKTVPAYDPSDPSKVLNPNGYPYIIGTTENVGVVPPYSDLLAGVLPKPKPPPVGPEGPGPEPPPVMDSDWPALVSGAGKTTLNGLYYYLDANNWKYSQYTMTKLGYPDPEVLVWAIIQGSTIFYYGEDTVLPWEVTVWTQSVGNPPVPTVVKQQPTGRKSEEPKKKKRFFF